MLDNKWSTGSLYQHIEPERGEDAAKTGPGDATGASSLNASGTATPAEGQGQNDLAARSGLATVNGVPTSSTDQLSGNAAGDAETFAAAPMFRWQPQFKNIWTTVEKSEAGNDGLVIRDKETSVTALKANFWGLHGVDGKFRGEIKL